MAFVRPPGSVRAQFIVRVFEIRSRGGLICSQLDPPAPYILGAMDCLGAYGRFLLASLTSRSSRTVGHVPVALIIVTQNPNPDVS